MSFLWPEFLWLGALLPVLVGLYLLALRRKNRLALRYASLSMVRDAMGAGQRVRRHIPPILFLVALALMIVAMARPVATVTLPTQHEYVILALDVSGSMRASDVKPTRIAAAQAAARDFINDQPSNVKIGIVSFAGTAAVVQPPTDNRDDLFAAIDRLQLQRATAIGSGLLISLKSIFPDVEFDLRASNPRIKPDKSAALDPTKPKKEPPKAVPAGSYRSAAIILLTDG
ncbi:MAG TPA: VWA domain-containing protein, partial [Casimicrobiaceae bacterium]